MQVSKYLLNQESLICAREDIGRTDLEEKEHTAIEMASSSI